MKRLIALACIGLAGSGIAQTADGWEEVARSVTKPVDVWSVKKGSVKVEPGTDGAREISGVFRSSRSKFTKVVKAQVSVGACRDGYGVVHIGGLSGRHRESDDFAVGAGNISSALAEYLCTVHDPFVGLDWLEPVMPKR